MPILAELYACKAEDKMFAGRSQESLRWATRALELPHSASTAVMTLHIRGNGRLELGDLDGMDDLWEALHQAEETATAIDIATSYSYLRGGHRRNRRRAPPSRAVAAATVLMVLIERERTGCWPSRAWPLTMLNTCDMLATCPR